MIKVYLFLWKPFPRWVRHQKKIEEKLQRKGRLSTRKVIFCLDPKRNLPMLEVVHTLWQKEVTSCQPERLLWDLPLKYQWPRREWDQQIMLGWNFEVSQIMVYKVKGKIVTNPRHMSLFHEGCQSDTVKNLLLFDTFLETRKNFCDRSPLVRVNVLIDTRSCVSIYVQFSRQSIWPVWVWQSELL